MRKSIAFMFPFLLHFLGFFLVRFIHSACWSFRFIHNTGFWGVGPASRQGRARYAGEVGDEQNKHIDINDISRYTIMVDSHIQLTV